MFDGYGQGIAFTAPERCVAEMRTFLNKLKIAVGAAAAASLSIALLYAAAPAHAQAYPQRPVRIIVNVSAGGGVDALARIAAQHYNALWGQPFVVDNRTGAGGSIGVEM